MVVYKKLRSRNLIPRYTHPLEGTVISLALPRTTGNKKTKQNENKEKRIPETDKPRPKCILPLTWPVGARSDIFLTDWGRGDVRDQLLSGPCQGQQKRPSDTAPGKAFSTYPMTAKYSTFCRSSSGKSSSTQETYSYVATKMTTKKQTNKNENKTTASTIPRPCANKSVGLISPTNGCHRPETRLRRVIMSKNNPYPFFFFDIRCLSPSESFQARVFSRVHFLGFPSSKRVFFVNILR